MAVAAIENRTPLRESLAYQVMGESLFELSRQIGWLNLVYRDGETDEPVYAFYHLTFQEYFAALAIEDWHFFLTHDNNNPQPLPGNIYRIFEPQWKEVILLWLGREDVEREQKKQFIQALVKFRDGIKNEFYGYRAYFLASSGVAEFQDCPWADEIVAHIVNWGFGDFFYIDKQQFTEAARTSLLQTNRGIAINKLIDLLKTTESWDTRWMAAHSLGEIGTGNEVAIAGLARILETTECVYTRWMAAHSLGEIDPGNEVAIAELLRILETTECVYTRRSAAHSLGEIDPGNEVAIAELLRILETTECVYTRRSAAHSLGEIDPGNKVAIAGLVRILEPTEEEDIRRMAAQSLREIGTGNEVAIAGLVKILETTESWDTRVWAAQSLREIGTGNEVAIAGIVRILETTEEEHTRRMAAYSLGEIDPGNEVAIAGIVRILETTEEEHTRGLAAYSLGEIDPGNEAAIAGLVQILETTESWDTRVWAAQSLREIGTGNEVAIAGIVRILETTEEEHTRGLAAYSLGEIDPGNEVAIAELLRILETTEEEHTRGLAAYSLGEILQKHQMPSTVSALQHYLTDESYEESCFDLFQTCYKIIWQCAQTLPYPTFYQAWHHPPITPPPEVAETTEVGFTPFPQCHNLAVFPRLLHTAINNDPHLRDKVQAICIDGSKFENPDNPASEIYAEMVMQGCPERQNGEPETMQTLKVYCQLKCQGVFLIFYEDTSGETPQSFSPTFLSSLSKFVNARRICVVSEQPCNLQTFSPTQPNLVADIVNWIREKMMED